MHLFISPHPDDAVLSCGGLMTQLAQAGETVVVYTLMAGPVPADVPISPFIEEHFVRWNLYPDPVPGRKAEDERAVDLLGGSVRFGPFPDALYRTDGHGVPLYPDLDALFGSINSHDPVLTAVFNQYLDAVVYAPLGAGHHVDHQLARDAVIRWMKVRPGVAVFFYEEYPYSASSSGVVESARSALGFPTVSVLHPLSEATLEAKIRAIACYESQISTFWDSSGAMAQAVRQYAGYVAEQHSAGGYAERVWCREGENQYYE